MDGESQLHSGIRQVTGTLGNMASHSHSSAKTPQEPMGQHNLVVSNSSLPSMARLWTPWNTMQLTAGVHTNTNIQPGSLTPGLCCSAAVRN